MPTDFKNQMISLMERDSLQKQTLDLAGDGSDVVAIRKTYSGFVSYQVSDPDTTLGGSLTINLEMSNDGVNWTPATDASGEVITHSISPGGTVLEKLSDVNPSINLRLAFASSVTGTLLISTRI